MAVDSTGPLIRPDKTRYEDECERVARTNPICLPFILYRFHFGAISSPSRERNSLRIGEVFDLL